MGGGHSRHAATQDQQVTYSTMVLAHVYIMGELRVVRSKGIEGVMETAGRPSLGPTPATRIGCCRSVPWDSSGRWTGGWTRLFPKRTSPSRACSIGSSTRSGSHPDCPWKRKGPRPPQANVVQGALPHQGFPTGRAAVAPGRLGTRQRSVGGGKGQRVRRRALIEEGPQGCFRPALGRRGSWY